MTITALFRDFLILNKAKKEYEECIVANAHPTIPIKFPIDWLGDKLFELIKERQKVSPYSNCNNEPHYEWLVGANSGYSTFSWTSSKSGRRFWGDLSTKWRAYYEKNASKIASQ